MTAVGIDVGKANLDVMVHGDAKVQRFARSRRRLDVALTRWTSCSIGFAVRCCARRAACALPVEKRDVGSKRGQALARALAGAGEQA